MTPQEMAARILAAYRQLAAEPGVFVTIAGLDHGALAQALAVPHLGSMGS